MLNDVMPGTEELLKKERVKGYIGFDPTADSLGVGNLVQIMILLHFQRAGHTPIALIGGATGMVGDPSGKSQERNLLNDDILQHNRAYIRSTTTPQLQHTDVSDVVFKLTLLSTLYTLHSAIHSIY